MRSRRFVADRKPLLTLCPASALMPALGGMRSTATWTTAASKSPTTPPRTLRTEEERRAIVAEAMQGRRNASAVACKHGVAPSLLFRWKRLYAAQGKPACPPSPPAFMPIIGGIAVAGIFRCCNEAGRNDRDRDGRRSHIAGGGGYGYRRAQKDRGGAGDGLMIPVPAGVRVWLATGHTDMRLSGAGAHGAGNAEG